MSDIKKKSILRPLPKVIEVLKDRTIVGKAPSPKASRSSSPKIPIPEKLQKTNFILERYRIFMEKRKKKQQIKNVVNERIRARHDALMASSNSSPTQELIVLEEYRKYLKEEREQILGNKKFQKENYDPHGFGETY